MGRVRGNQPCGNGPLGYVRPRRKTQNNVDMGKTRYYDRGGGPTCRNCGGSTGEHERESFTNRNCPLPTVEINGLGQSYPWGRWLGSILRIRVAGAKATTTNFNHEGRHVGDTRPEDRHKRKSRIFNISNCSAVQHFIFNILNLSMFNCSTLHRFDFSTFQHFSCSTFDRVQLFNCSMFHLLNFSNVQLLKYFPCCAP